MDDQEQRGIEDAKRRHAELQWSQLKANPDLTDEERQRKMATGYASDEEREAEEAERRKRAEDEERRMHERQQRLMLERVLLTRARRAGFRLTRADGRLTWEQSPTPLQSGPRRADIVRAPRRQRSGTQRSARAPGQLAEGDDGEIDRLRANARAAAMVHVSEPLEQLLGEFMRRWNA